MSHAPGDHANRNAEWQVEYMRTRKGISFSLATEDEAIGYLRDSTYFFKLKAFAKNFDTRQKQGPDQGKYINLDFGHLVELSKLDAHLRSTALSLSLDVEHHLKVRVNRAAMEHGVNPCALTESFLSFDSHALITGQAGTLDVESGRTALMAASEMLANAADSGSVELRAMTAMSQISRS